MSQQDETVNAAQPQDDGDDNRETGLGPRLTDGLRRAKDSAEQSLQRSGQTMSDTADAARQGLQRTGEAISEATDTARQGLQRSGEVLTGADIRNFDDFTEAVTRVCVGLHQDNVQLRERITHLERSLEESKSAQAELMDRVAALEGKTADNPSSQR